MARRDALARHDRRSIHACSLCCICDAGYTHAARNSPPPPPPQYRDEEVGDAARDAHRAAASWAGTPSVAGAAPGGVADAVGALRLRGHGETRPPWREAKETALRETRPPWREAPSRDTRGTRRAALLSYSSAGQCRLGGRQRGAALLSYSVPPCLPPSRTPAHTPRRPGRLAAGPAGSRQGAGPRDRRGVAVNRPPKQPPLPHQQPLLAAVYSTGAPPLRHSCLAVPPAPAPGPYRGLCVARRAARYLRVTRRAGPGGQRAPLRHRRQRRPVSHPPAPPPASPECINAWPARRPAGPPAGPRVALAAGSVSRMSRLSMGGLERLALAAGSGRGYGREQPARAALERASPAWPTARPPTAGPGRRGRERLFKRRPDGSRPRRPPVAVGEGGPSVRGQRQPAPTGPRPTVPPP